MPRTPSHPLPFALGVVALIGVGALAAWYFTSPGSPPEPVEPGPPEPDPPTPDPRLVFDTPFRNVKPGVKYVGDAACAGCHAAVARAYHAHPMGRSAEFVSRGSPVERYDPAGHASFSWGRFELAVEKTSAGARHTVRVSQPAATPVPEFVLPVEVAIGSGTRGRSYLSVENGSVWQSPVSWFGPERRWDLSPGFRLGVAAMRPIVPACLNCHVDRVEPVPGATNRYREPVFAAQVSIGCERCHGPGELHALERKGAPPAGVDTSIVNPRHLSAPLQTAVCEQCHLQGEERVPRRGRDLFEYRPGLPFEQFVSVHVRHPEIATPNKSVGQFEQMEQSRCFSGSRGSMLCTSCHDPHSAPEPAARDAHYRQKCLSCHDSRGCALPQPDRQAKGDSCIACHMPKAASANIIHASVTDHSVPRTPGSRPPLKGLPFGTPPLVRFRDGPLSPPPEERERDLGIALAAFARKRLPEEILARSDPRPLAKDRLQASLSRWPGDADAWLALAAVRLGQVEQAERVRAAKNAVALAGESEAALAALVEAATAAGRYDLALEAADARVRLNPAGPDPLLSRGIVHLARDDWGKAENDCRAVLRVNPLHPQAHLQLAICLHKRGNPAEAQRELNTALQLEADPREQAALADWFRRAAR